MVFNIWRINDFQNPKIYEFSPSTPLSALSPVQPLAPINQPPLSMTKPFSLVTSQDSNSSDNPEDSSQMKLKNTLLAEQIMHYPVCVVSIHDSFRQVWQKMQNSGHRFLPVVDVNLKLCGIISKHDLMKEALRLARHKTQSQLKLQDLMQSQVISTGLKTSIDQIAAVLLEQNLSCMVICRPDLTLAGIITKHDLLQAVALK